MIGYITVGTNDLERACKFYDELLGSIGASRFLEYDRGVAWAINPETPSFSVCTPFDENDATVATA